MLITPKYAEEQRYLHESTDPYLAYGDRGFNWAYLVYGIAKLESCKTILDYGCGKGSLGRALTTAGCAVQNYDPGVPGFSGSPSQAELVVSLDTLEHVEPDLLSTVLGHIKQLCTRRLFVSVCTRPAKRVLRDGRNAHLIIEPGSWWRNQLERQGFVMRREWPTGTQDWVALMNACLVLILC